MVKNVKNDKVIRAITIGLATMIASTSLPVTVLANEGEPQDSQPIEDNNQQSNDNQETKSSDTQSITEAYNAADTADETAASASNLVAEAAGAVVEISGDTADIQLDLGNGFSEVAAIQDNLSEAMSELQSAMVLETKYEKKAEETNKTVETLETEPNNLDQSSEKTVQNSDKAIDDATKANTSGSKTKAYQARDDAVQEYQTAQNELEKSAQIYETVAEAAQKAESDYKNAKTEHDKAVENLEKAKVALKDAQTNATAANEYLKAAQARVQSLTEKTQKYAETKESLEAIKNQYYGMLVQYYREVLGAKETVYNADGSLNIQANAEKITKQEINNKANSPGDTVMELGRDLMKKLVTYKVMNDANVDLESAEFVFGDAGKTTKKAREGVVFASDEKTEAGNGKDQVATTKDRTDIDGQSVKHNDTYTYKWDQSVQNDNGRTNHVHVQYKDKDGVVHDEYYNYIYKSAKYGDQTDLENGQIYLAQIEKNNDGIWEVKRVVNDDNNFDDYQKLTSVLDAINDLADYEKAVKAVNDAADKVNNLQDQIDKLQNISIDNTKLNELKERLDQALEDFSVALENKAALEEKVEEARKAVESIDLSRFNTREESADDVYTPTPDESGSVLGTIPTVERIIFNGIAEPDGSINIPALTGVAGARTETPQQFADFAENVQKETKNQNVQAGNKVVTILEDEELPAAAAISESEKETMSWWWLLIVALFGTTGMAWYEKHKADQEKKR